MAQSHTRAAARFLARAQREKEATAHHEAGHAILSIVLKRPLVRVSIRPDAETFRFGICQGRPCVPAWLDWEAEDQTPRARRWFERELVVLYAGQVAEAKFLGRAHAPHGAGHDDGTAADFALKFCGQSEDEASAFLGWMYARARTLVNVEHHWHGVRRLAEALLEREELSGRSIRKVWHASLDESRQGIS
jgi:ATP-dependent Zn protease